MNTPVEHTTETFSFLGLLDRTFRLYREHFAIFVGAVAIVIIPFTIIQFLLSAWELSNVSSVSGLSRTAAASQTSGAVLIASIASLIILVIQSSLEIGAVTYLTSESYLGHPISIRQAFSDRRSRFSNVGCGYISLFLIIGVFSFVIGVAGLVFTPAFACFGVVAYIGIAAFVFLVPVLMLENVYTPLGVNRAWSLGKARFWTVVALYATLSLLVVLLNVAFSTVLRLLLVAVTGPLGIVPTLAVTTILGAIGAIFLTPIVPIGLTLLYHDTRNRLEGLDFALQALGKPDARPADVLSSVPKGGLVSKDWINLGIIMAITIILALLIAPTITSLIQRLTPAFTP